VPLPGHAGAAFCSRCSRRGVIVVATPPNNNKRQKLMATKTKFRQAGLILFATAVVLILPNLTRLFT